MKKRVTSVLHLYQGAPRSDRDAAHSLSLTGQSLPGPPHPATPSAANGAETDTQFCTPDARALTVPVWLEADSFIIITIIIEVIGVTLANKMTRTGFFCKQQLLVLPYYPLRSFSSNVRTVI